MMMMLMMMMMTMMMMSKEHAPTTGLADAHVYHTRSQSIRWCNLLRE